MQGLVHLNTAQYASAFHFFSVRYLPKFVEPMQKRKRIMSVYCVKNAQHFGSGTQYWPAPPSFNRAGELAFPAELVLLWLDYTSTLCIT